MLQIHIDTYLKKIKTTARVLNMVVLALVFYGACYGKSCISFLLPFFLHFMKVTDFLFCYSGVETAVHLRLWKTL